MRLALAASLAAIVAALALFLTLDLSWLTSWPPTNSAGFRTRWPRLFVR